MASKKCTTEEVLAFLDAKDCEEDDRQEIFMEGSDEEFDDLDEMEYGIIFIISFYITLPYRRA